MNCPKCNTPLPSGALFCPSCGSKVEAGEITNPTLRMEDAAFFPNLLSREARTMAGSAILTSVIALLTMAAYGYPRGSDIFLYLVCVFWTAVVDLFLWIALWLATKNDFADCSKWGFRMVLLGAVSLFYSGDAFALGTAGLDVPSFGPLELLGFVFGLKFFHVASKSHDKRLSRLSKYVLASAIIGLLGALADAIFFAFVATLIEVRGLSRILAEPKH